MEKDWTETKIEFLRLIKERSVIPSQNELKIYI